VCAWFLVVQATANSDLVRLPCHPRAMGFLVGSVGWVCAAPGPASAVLVYDSVFFSQSALSVCLLDSPGSMCVTLAREDGYGSMMNRRIPFAGRRLKSHGHRSMMDVWIPYGGQQVKYVGARDDHRQHHQPYVGRFDPPPRGPWSSPVDMMGHYEYPCPTGGADRGGWAGQRPSLVTTYHPSGSLSLYPPSMTRHGPNMATSGYTAVVAHCAPTAPPQGFYAPLLPSYASMVPLMAPLPTPAVAAAGVTTGVPPASLVEHQRPRLQQQQAARGRVADPQRQDAILHGRGT